MHVILMPAILSTKQCFDYCGGQPIFKELLASHSDILRPTRTTERGDSFYRRESVDTALRIAEAQGTLIAEGQETADRPAPVLEKKGRRFKKGQLDPSEPAPLQ